MSKIKYQWRITKYNPIFRNEKGHYLVDEWTCPSQIGNKINGNLFTLESYLLIEHAYVETLIKFLVEKRQYSLRVIQVSNRLITQEDKISMLYEQEFSEIDMKEDMLANIFEIRIICKMILRNFADCQLFSKDNFFVHFGWDYYMYIGSSQNSLIAVAFADNSGLFVEEYRSPYYVEEKDITRVVQWSEIDAEIPLVVGDEQIDNVGLEEYRNIFDLSDEHPIIGYFDITTKDHMEFFQKLLKHKIDFTKYEYGLWAGY